MTWVARTAVALFLVLVTSVGGCELTAQQVKTYQQTHPTQGVTP